MLPRLATINKGKIFSKLLRKKNYKKLEFKMKIQLLTVILILKAFLLSQNGVAAQAWIRECTSSKDCNNGEWCKISKKYGNYCATLKK